ncbi:MAG: hypothetical protein Q7U04_17620 [Bacteriovorax sp.]|nr:hypothetical protein [Bacteriovorax sp.]
MIIVSDANIIVYFWKVDLLEKLHTSVVITIPEQIFSELTQNRIKASYPDLSALINEHRYNPTIENAIQVIQIEHEVDETLAMHEHIKENSGLDDGEIDGIMLSVLSGNLFVTNDTDAIEFFNEVLEHDSAGCAQTFEEFLNHILDEGYIDEGDVDTLLEVKKSRN